MSTKTCSKCGDSFPLSQFHRRQDTADGLRGDCKQCHRDTGFFSTTCSNAKRRAKEKGVEFNLDKDYLKSIDRSECPYLEIPISVPRIGVGQGHTQPYSKTLDRIRPELGYVKGNVIWCSACANNLLSNYTAEKLLAIPLLYRVGLNFMRVLNSTKPTNQ